MVHFTPLLDQSTESQVKISNTLSYGLEIKLAWKITKDKIQ